MKQMSFVDYFFEEQKRLLKESEQHNQKMEWEEAISKIQNWIDLLEPIRQWNQAMFPVEIF